MENIASADVALFEPASAYVQGHANELSEEQLLALYGLYKCATVGPCDTKKPGFWQVKESRKWTAWSDLGKLEKENAKRKYVELVMKYFNSPTLDLTQKSGGLGQAVSRPVAPEDAPTRDPPIFDAAKTGDLATVRSYAGDINIRDEEGLSLLHWAVDRGHLDVVKCLIEEKSIDTDPIDSDGDTPLAYAVTCGLLDVAEYLLCHCDRNHKNNADETPTDLASENMEMNELFERM